MSVDGNENVEGRLPVEGRLFSDGPKRILALDGGGLRGIVSIAFLAEIEKQLREETGNPNLVLSDVFDLVIGTSVGSMLATMIALGHPVEEIEAKFREMAGKIFTGRMTIFRQKRFDAGPLVDTVHSVVKDTQLGSPELRTGLGVVTKRIDKGSVWVLTNNPRMPYYEDGPGWDGNKRYKLVSIVRASTSAPFLFKPPEITIHTDRFGKEEKGVFVDGSVSPHNSPCLLALLMAALPAYKMNWVVSPKDLLIISVGAGTHRVPVDRSEKVFTGIRAWLTRRIDSKLADDIEEAAFAANALQGMIADGSQFALKVMQALSHPRFSWWLNSEIGSLDGEILFRIAGGDQNVAQELFKFQRYDLALETGLFDQKYAAFDVAASNEERKALHAIDDPSILEPLHALAKDAAARQVSRADFSGFV